MDYESRKAQLNNTMKSVLYNMKYGFCFSDEELRVFFPQYFGDKHKEVLKEVFIDEDRDGEVTIVTYSDEEGYIDSPFTEFSNEEMETIMRLCGVNVPKEEDTIVNVYVTIVVEK